jgi:hypothetical protein
MNDFVLKCKNYAVSRHTNTNHQYDGKPYSVHLEITHHFALMFKHLLPEILHDSAEGGSWCHDVVEDTRESFNDVKLMCSVDVAEVAYACANEKGRTRKERADERYYEGIRQNPVAWFVKICDRLANIWYSKNSESRMFEVYKLENEEFKRQLYNTQFKTMFDYMDELLNN